VRCDEPRETDRRECDLISTASWKGARLSDVLNLAGGLRPTAVGLAFLSTDEFSAGLPPDVVDGNIVSCRGWPDMPEWSRAFMALLDRAAVPA